MKIHKIRVAKLAVASALVFSTALSADEPKPDEPKPLVVTKLKFSPFVPWQLDSWNTKRLSPDNPDKRLIDAEVASLTGRYEKSESIRANVAEPVQLRTGVLNRLFPKHRFYLVGWDEQAAEGKKDVHLAFGLYYAFIIGPNDEVTKLSGFGNFEEYGQFASKNGIKIKSSEDARLFWLAFCDIHQKEWHSRDLNQVSPTEWHLGLYETDNPFWKEQHRYWYRVILDDNQKVMSAKLLSEDIKK